MLKGKSKTTRPRFSDDLHAVGVLMHSHTICKLFSESDDLDVETHFRTMPDQADFFGSLHYCLASKLASGSRKEVAEIVRILTGY